jgi:hypothetical protein
VIDFKSKQGMNVKERNFRMSFSVLPLLDLKTTLVLWRSASLKHGQDHQKEEYLYSLRVVECKSILVGKIAESSSRHHLLTLFVLQLRARGIHDGRSK